MGAGDGSHGVGPGTLVLRFSGDDPAQPTRVELRAFELHEHFAVEPKSVLWSAKVVTDAVAKATPDADGIAAVGALTKDTVRWSTPVRAYRADGVVQCSGSLCGNFGAPQAGRSETHSAPHPVRFESLRFGASGLTFEMLGYAVVSQEQSPRAKTLLILRGRASSWVCARPRPTST